MEEQRDESKVKGGIARAEKLSPEERSEIARMGASARWTKNDKIIKVECDGVLKLGDGVEIPCAVLPNGTRVISERAVIKALGGKRGGAHWRRKKADEGGANLPVYLSAKNIIPFIPEDLTTALNNLIPYRTLTGGISHGLEATLLPQVCDVWLKVRDAGKELKSQKKMVIAADMLLRSFAKVGIIALIDEATGYQEKRSRDALQQLLSIYLTEEKLRWAKTFPDEFYKQIFRLNGWKYNPLDQRRPKVIGKLTNQVVYKKLPPGVLEKLRELNPVKNKKTWRRGAAHFQYLSSDIGQPDLRDHFLQVMPLMRVSDNWKSFIKLLTRAIPDHDKKDDGIQEELDFIK